MKYIRFIFIAFVSVLILTACGGDDKKGSDSPIDPVITEGQTYTQSVTLDAKGTQQTVMLNDLKSKIDNVGNSNSWLTVLINSYTSGSPCIVLSATENTYTQPRSGNVTLYAANGDKVILSVTQQGVEETKTGIDDSHDVPTDKPAYSRRK